MAPGELACALLGVLAMGVATAEGSSNTTQDPARGGTEGAGVGTATMAGFPAGGHEMEFPYWIAGTAFPCTSVDECTFLVNGSDAFGGDDVVVDNRQLTGPCIISGHLKIAKNWHGYLATFKLRPEGAKIYYHFSYPEEKCCIKVLLYLEEQVGQLRYRMNCLQKLSVLDPTSPQVITLSPFFSPSGCKTNKTRVDYHGVETRRIECTSGRLLKSDIERNWYIGASSCGAPTGLDLEYTIVAYGYVGECPTSYHITSGASRLMTSVTPGATWNFVFIFSQLSSPSMHHIWLALHVFCVFFSSRKSSW